MPTTRTRPTTTAPTLDTLITDAVAAYDLAVTAWSYTRAVAHKLDRFPQLPGECPCGCERGSATLAVARADATCSAVSGLVTALRALREQAAA